MPLHFCDTALRAIAGVALATLTMAPVAGNNRATDTPPLLRIEVREPGGQVLSYRHLAGSTDVVMRGTRLAREAQVKLKIGSRPGFVELDINRGGITGLPPAHTLGRDFLTYVLWAVSVDGRASNLGEITFETDRAVPVNVTTPYQTFWLMITAEPNYAVVDPSQHVVLYSVEQSSTSENKALAISKDLFFFTHYPAYAKEAGGVLPAVPNQLLQARKAVELASKSEVLVGRSGRGGNNNEEAFTRRALAEASAFLTRAEEAFSRNPRSQEVVQFARTAAQSAENARALAMGAVGGLVIRQLQDEVDRLNAELLRLRPAPATGAGPSVLVPGGPALPGASAVTTTAAVPAIAVPLAKQPALWFAVAGWLLAIVVLFRRRSA